jgi:hypothetical protein
VGTSDEVTKVVEQGEILFFYRPRVGTDEVSKLQDVQRFFFVMLPERTQRFRRLIVGRKRLPDPLRHERTWAFVAEVGDCPESLREELVRKAYETGTGGVRIQPEARPAGEGRYAIVEHNGHSHLVYVLLLPRSPGEAQEAFGIRSEASYITAVRNPSADAPTGTGLSPRQRAKYPPQLMERFRRRRFAPLDDPRFLDYEGAEIVLIGAAVDVEAELNVDIDVDELQLDPSEIFRKLRLPPGELPTEPLERGVLR